MLIAGKRMSENPSVVAVPTVKKKMTCGRESDWVVIRMMVTDEIF